MNDRNRAISLLQQAREILAERLTERVLESREAILEDALGLSFSSEIDAIQEQIGQRLNHVNILLSNLPSIEEPPPPDDAAPQSATQVLEYDPNSLPESTDSPSEPEASLADSVPPTSVIYVSTEAQATVGPSFQEFVRSVMTGDVEAAGGALADWLQISPERGRECAQRFREQLREQPQTLQKAMSLRQEVAAGSVNSALLLLWECFGLQGVESLAALQTLKSRLTSTPTA